MNTTYLYYCLNSSTKSTRTNKLTQVKSIKITHIPEHISIRICSNKSFGEFVTPSVTKMVVFPSVDEQVYSLVKQLLFPVPNERLALQNVENRIELVRLVAVSIIRQRVTRKKFDDWLALDTIEYTCIR
jgi:hypothetical protein